MSRPLPPEEFDRLFRTLRESAFRLETLPQYLVEEEAEEFRLFLEGKPRPAPDEGYLSWLDMIRSHVSAGRWMQRIHLIRGELTPYLRFEMLWGYVDTVAAGEDVRIVQVDEGELAELGTQDFWLFDDAVAVLMGYDSEGVWLGQELSTDPAVVDECRRKRDLARTLAVPLSTFLQEVGTA